MRYRFHPKLVGKWIRRGATREGWAAYRDGRITLIARDGKRVPLDAFRFVEIPVGGAGWVWSSDDRPLPFDEMVTLVYDILSLVTAQRLRTAWRALIADFIVRALVNPPVYFRWREQYEEVLEKGGNPWDVVAKRLGYSSWVAAERDIKSVEESIQDEWAGLEEELAQLVEGWEDVSEDYNP